MDSQPGGGFGREGALSVVGWFSTVSEPPWVSPESVLSGEPGCQIGVSDGA